MCNIVSRCRKYSTLGIGGYPVHFAPQKSLVGFRGKRWSWKNYNMLKGLPIWRVLTKFIYSIFNFPRENDRFNNMWGLISKQHIKNDSNNYCWIWSLTLVFERINFLLRLKACISLTDRGELFHKHKPGDVLYRAIRAARLLNKKLKSFPLLNSCGGPLRSNLKCTGRAQHVSWLLAGSGVQGLLAPRMDGWHIF